MFGSLDVGDHLLLSFVQLVDSRVEVVADIGHGLLGFIENGCLFGFQELLQLIVVMGDFGDRLQKLLVVLFHTVEA